MKPGRPRFPAAANRFYPTEKVNVVTKPLVVVESPTKVKTLKKYLGDAYNVAATVGHIKDLPSKEMGIDIENGFKPQYKNIPGKQKVITALKKEAGDAEEVYLAPDPDREGEAIAWHTADVLKKKGRRFHRVLFHELTKNGIQQAMRRPEDLNTHKYEAQQARRILDRLVGYQISPLLWRKVKNGLSAGRVQSVALRIICERERTIQAFEPDEYWSITAHLHTGEPPVFAAKLFKKKGKKLSIPDEAAAKAILDDLADAAYRVDEVKRRTTKRNPQPPFTTSRLQQDANRRLRFTAKRTMAVAQQLYEGLELEGGEPVGLITYMRTDSTRIAAEAAGEALELVKEQFGADYALEKPRFFRNRKKAQDAHEAIRPTSVALTPEKVRPFLNDEQHKLYTLIWQRFVASQMAQALIDRNTVLVGAGDYQFKATGSTVRFPGFMALYQVSDEAESDSGDKAPLPELEAGVELKLEKIDPKQHFTQPPPRFNEASLVKELEENGIGRPSTYASILSTIRGKGYVERDRGYFRPTELGFIVNDLVVANFPDILDVEFTARMEDDLDRVEQAEEEALKLLERFYAPFSKELESAADGMLSMKGVGVPTGLNCPECGNPLHIKVGKNGPFVACSGYPDCHYSRDYTRDERGRIEIIEPVTEVSDEVCEKCGSPMVTKQGRYGTFLACSAYPECKNTRSVASAAGASTGVPCPEPNCKGELVERRSRRGKVFYGCNQYPDCTYATWDRPVPVACPACGGPFMVEKTTKKEGKHLRCPDRECGHREFNEWAAESAEEASE